MDKIILGIKKGDYKFNTVIKPIDGFVSAELILIKNDILGKMIFRSDYKAKAILGNLTFIGTTISNDNWHIYHNLDNIVLKRYETIGITRYRPVINENIEKKAIYDKDSFYRNDEFQKFFNHIIEINIEKYNLIENKTDFNRQLKEYLFEAGYFLYENDEEKLNYLLFDDKGNNVRKQLEEECTEYFERYINSEKDMKNLWNIITLENVIKYCPEIRKIDKITLRNLFETWKNDNINLSIEQLDYDKKALLISIGEELVLLNKKRLRKDYNDKFPVLLKQIFGDSICNMRNIEYLYLKTLSYFPGDEIPEKNKVIEIARENINLLSKFNTHYEILMKHYGSNEVWINIDDKDISIFEQKNFLDENKKIEYQYVFNPIVEAYRKYCCSKRNYKPKSTVLQFESFVLYAKKIFDILIDNKYLIKVNQNYEPDYYANIDEEKIKQQILDLKR